MFRIFVIILAILIVLGTAIGVEPSCTLTLGAHGDTCQPGQGETLGQHLAHATNTFPELLASSVTALIAFAALVSSLLPRAPLLPPRHLLLSPEQPPRFA